MNHRRTLERQPPPGILACIVLFLLQAGCAGLEPEPVPEAIVIPPAGDLQLVEAGQSPDDHLGTRVRWGGTIIRVERDASGNSRVEVVERRLDDTGRPLPGSPSDGRFIILAAPSVDPDLYARGGEVTVAGVLADAVDGRIGDAPTRLPVVRVEQFVRWEPRWRSHPYYYDPWYGPHYRFGVGIGHGFHHPYHPGFWHHPYYHGW
jgi:outer membrane lipoprotein